MRIKSKLLVSVMGAGVAALLSAGGASAALSERPIASPTIAQAVAGEKPVLLAKAKTTHKAAKPKAAAPVRGDDDDDDDDDD